MFFSVSEGVKSFCAAMVSRPEEWVQGEYYFTNTTHTDIRVWTCNGIWFLRISGFDCLTLAEKIYISNAIKKTMAARIGTLLKKEVK